MAQQRAYNKGGNLIFTNGKARGRVVDIIGPNVWKYDLRPDILNATTVDPTGWTTTVVEAGAGNTEFDPNDTGNRVGTITCAANENDGGSYQLLGENLICQSGQLWYVGLEGQSNDADQSDLFFGVAVVDTALLGGVADAVYFESLDGSLDINFVAEKGSSETTASAVGTMADAVDNLFEIFWDGTRLLAYLDGVKVSDSIPTNLPDTEAMRLSIEYLTGEAIANTFNVKRLRAIAAELF